LSTSYCGARLSALIDRLPQVDITTDAGKTMMNPWKMLQAAHSDLIITQAEAAEQALVRPVAT
jgi:hypothetical protein